MNRFEFGMLVASLREDMRWTQLELAEKSGLDVSVISNIERGARRTLLKDNMLLKLADGLQLTTMERQEFLFAASGVPESDAVRKGNHHARIHFDPESFLREQGEHIGCIALPILVIDSFCDILLANHFALEYYNTPVTLMKDADDVVGGYNMMRYVFHARSTFQDGYKEDEWEIQALVNLRHFRKRTMRVRSKPYFSILLKELLNNKNYPSFERYWRKMLFESFDYYSAPIGKPDPDNDNAVVGLESHLAVTPYGELFLQKLLPMNKKTSKRFEEIMTKVGEGYMPFAPFPDKQKQ
ncbi:MAG: helix-turn-helix domain-containing protein [Anaerolineales bacterium]|nr:helix-turn-helix domain-containing protein [Anaerolineales bacterium]